MTSRRTRAGRRQCVRTRHEGEHPGWMPGGTWHDGEISSLPRPTGISPKGISVGHAGHRRESMPSPSAVIFPNLFGPGMTTAEAAEGAEVKTKT